MNNDYNNGQNSQQDPNRGQNYYYGQYQSYGRTPLDPNLLRPHSSGLAVTSLVLGIIGIFFSCCGIVGIVGVILGALGLVLAIMDRSRLGCFSGVSRGGLITSIVALCLCLCTFLCTMLVISDPEFMSIYESVYESVYEEMYESLVGEGYEI